MYHFDKNTFNFFKKIKRKRTRYEKERSIDTTDLLRCLDSVKHEQQF